MRCPQRPFEFALYSVRSGGPFFSSKNDIRVKSFGWASPRSFSTLPCRRVRCGGGACGEGGNGTGKEGGKRRIPHTSVVVAVPSAGSLTSLLSGAAMPSPAHSLARLLPDGVMSLARSIPRSLPDGVIFSHLSSSLACLPMPSPRSAPDARHLSLSPQSFLSFPPHTFASA